MNMTSYHLKLLAIGKMSSKAQKMSLPNHSRSSFLSVPNSFWGTLLFYHFKSLSKTLHSLPSITHLFHHLQRCSPFRCFPTGADGRAVGELLPEGLGEMTAVPSNSEKSGLFFAPSKTNKDSSVYVGGQEVVTTTTETMGSCLHLPNGKRVFDPHGNHPRRYQAAEEKLRKLSAKVQWFPRRL